MSYKVEYQYIGMSDSPITRDRWVAWQASISSYPNAPFQPDPNRNYTFPTFLEAHLWADHAQSERIRLGRQTSTPIQWRVVEERSML